MRLLRQNAGRKFDWPRARKLIAEGLRRYLRLDLRVWHLAIVGMLIFGVAVNLLLPHGWTVWPFVAAAALMLAVHEAAERNAQGIPPLYVYLFFVSAMALWLVVVMIASAVNPVVLLLGFAGAGYYGVKGYLKSVERSRLFAKRRAEHLCIHCGQPVNPDLAFCANCGEDPDPDGARLARVATASVSSQAKSRIRAALAPPAPATSAAQKEQALLSRRHRRRG